MFGNDVRQQLKVACRFFGGQKAVAERAGIDNSNFGKWLKGGSTLSEENVLAVLDVLGLPNGKPDESRVHLWKIKSVTLKNYVPALKLYFPTDAQIAGASWSQPGFQHPAKMFLPSKYNDNVFALTDGKLRAILRLPRSVIIQKENIGSHVKWRNGTRAKSILNITEEDEAWVRDTPTIAEFDSVWFGTSQPVSGQDVLRAIEEEKISFEEAIRRIRKPD